ncbi:LL-diaminopimelate aminotransferase [Thermospira aquatica]|uniref:LL-diaminopimelate aminotransferase n=1 Tax=Thermospira aquatica TaxID=2828656 RepID=A0AAX3BFJ1_9SPIR|nr:LL-diaminopimelate aminotransferase [Thermospira aquatica]URA10945.1 LL-diaminopimelate aminotransferase [Thermospira aquatica]
MVRVNENYTLLQGSYLFSEVAKRVRMYQEKNPEKKIIRLGIGDVTQPLVPSVVKAFQEGVEEMSKKESFHGYGPEQGYEFLREAIAEVDFRKRGIDISPDEIFISTGAKEDTANFQELFDQKVSVAIPDPVYPVYVDSNVMAGRSGRLKNGRYERFFYLDATLENNFKPEIPKKRFDLIYLCFPNNPTGQVLTRDELKAWVEYAHKYGSILFFDAAYEAFVSDPSLPKSIFEIEGAREVAVEFRSLSKTAGFTGTRCAYTIVPRDVKVYTKKGHAVSLHALWFRRQSTKFNGVSYPVQKAAAAVFTPEGQKEIQEVLAYYKENARIILEAIREIGFPCTGGTHSPYIWFKTPMDSWKFFDYLLERVQIVGTPGIGFGKNGDGFFRLSAFGDRSNVKEAIERLKTIS